MATTSNTPAPSATAVLTSLGWMEPPRLTLDNFDVETAERIERDLDLIYLSDDAELIDGSHKPNGCQWQDSSVSPGWDYLIDFNILPVRFNVDCRGDIVGQFVEQLRNHAQRLASLADAVEKKGTSC